MCISSICFLFATQSIISDLVIYPLEHGSFSGVKAKQTDKNEFSHIVVLGCNYRNFEKLPELDRWPRCSLLRLLRAINLYQENPQAYIVLTAGDFGNWGESFATKSARFLEDRGIPKSRLVIVSEGHDTKSEVLALASLNDAKKIALVTSASHQYRAQYYFAQQNMPVYGFPTDFLSNGSLDFAPHLPEANCLITINRALHEYLGILEALIFG